MWLLDQVLRDSFVWKQNKAQTPPVKITARHDGTCLWSKLWERWGRRIAEGQGPINHRQCCSLFEQRWQLLLFSDLVYAICFSPFLDFVFFVFVPVCSLNHPTLRARLIWSDSNRHSAGFSLPFLLTGINTIWITDGPRLLPHLLTANLRVEVRVKAWASWGLLWVPRGIS